MCRRLHLRRWRPLFAGLVAWIGLGGAASCSSDDLVPGGGRIEHPVEPGPTIESGPTKATPASTVHAPAQASAAEMSAPSVDSRSSLSEIYEQKTGIKLSPLDRAIVDDCPARAWSKNVPQRHCTTDDECGDGFCDRDRCASFWTCFIEYSGRCASDDHCGPHLCIDGRCRSCVSDAECKRAGIQDGECLPDPIFPGARDCYRVEGSGPRGVCRHPWVKNPGDNIPYCPPWPSPCQGPNRNAPWCK